MREKNWIFVPLSPCLKGYCYIFCCVFKFIFFQIDWPLKCQPHNNCDNEGGKDFMHSAHPVNVLQWQKSGIEKKYFHVFRHSPCLIVLYYSRTKKFRVFCKFFKLPKYQKLQKDFWNFWYLGNSKYLQNTLKDFVL